MPIALPKESNEPERPGNSMTTPSPAVLRGTQNGLEILINESGSLAAILSAVEERLAEAPDFFAGGNALLRFESSVPPGALAALEKLLARFDVGIHGVRSGLAPSAAAPQPLFADGSGPRAAAEQPSGAPDVTVEMEHSAPRLLVGPVRSGVVLHTEGHLIVLGDVNPGAEVRARGSIIVLGRLRGIAHAAFSGQGAGGGFILALKLEPQQLRVGDLVARSGEDTPGQVPELAYAVEGAIVVVEYVGKLPWHIATTKV